MTCYHCNKPAIGARVTSMGLTLPLCEWHLRRTETEIEHQESLRRIAVTASGEKSVDIAWEINRREPRY